ncbi:hypothetical protein IGI04_007082 [Brassica rapa subsp. trilocularis]|uniref:Lipoprotein n=1 Tax=Brassica rapa subsp. trilocularis TaxID=1813537 RepID=A0ABQ7NIQ0_BRACM|nr:hypothetical protein IGI04_007082 [Brassica rapa subsp. trilocularis]
MGLGLGIRPTLCLFSVFLCVSGCRNRPELSEMRERGRFKLSPTAWLLYPYFHRILVKSQLTDALNPHSGP